MLTDVFDDNIFNISINQDSEYHYISYVTDCCTNKHSGDTKIFVKKYIKIFSLKKRLNDLKNEFILYLSTALVSVSSLLSEIIVILGLI